MLYIFVEGPDDANFFDNIFGTIFGIHQTIQYAHLTKTKINNFLDSIARIPDSDYLFFGDEDGKGIDNKRIKLLDLYPHMISDRLFIVQYEIESWYYAGVTQEESKKLKLKKYQNDTDTLSKEQFNLKLSRPSERALVMQKILMNYSVELAQTRNISFKVFCSNYIGPAAV